MESTSVKKSEWFRDWFASKYYDILYNYRNAKEAEIFLSALIHKLKLPKTASILDLACGKGRHSIFLHSLGYSVTGVDLSCNSIDFANKWSDDDLSFQTADMRFLDLGEKFDCVMNLFTSFGYFDRIEDNNKVIQRVKEHLNPNGIFVLDYFNSSKVIRDKEEKYSLNRENIHFNIHKFIQDDFVIKHIQVDDEGKIENFQERVQLLKAEQLEEMLIQNGLTPFARYGDYALGEFISGESERLIIIARN